MKFIDVALLLQWLFVPPSQQIRAAAWAAYNRVFLYTLLASVTSGLKSVMSEYDIAVQEPKNDSRTI